MHLCMEHDMDIFDLWESLGGERPKTKKERKLTDTAKDVRMTDADGRKPSGKSAAGNAPCQKAKIKLPDRVTCIGNHFRVTIEGAGTLDDCVRRLVDLGYKEILLSGKCIFISKDVLLFQSFDRVVEDSVLVNMPMSICAGEKRMELDMDDFPELDKDEISVLDIHERWIAVHPEDEGSGLSYNPQLGVATPYISKTGIQEQKNIELPVRVSILGDIITITQQDVGIPGTITCGQLCEYLSTSYSLKYQEAELSLFDYGGILLAGFRTGKKTQTFGIDAYFVDKGAHTKKVKEKYMLPLTLYMANFNISVPLSPEDFEGRGKIEQEEILGYVKNKYPMFRSSDRKIDILYYKERNMVSVAAMSGKKGNV